MGLCTSRPMDPNEAAKGSYAHKQAVRMQNERLKTVDRQSTLVVQDPQDYSITRINGLSMKAIGNALMFPDKQMPCKSIIQANYVCRKGDQCEYAHRQTNLTYFLDCLSMRVLALISRFFSADPHFFSADSQFFSADSQFFSAVSRYNATCAPAHSSRQPVALNADTPG